MDVSADAGPDESKPTFSASAFGLIAAPRPSNIISPILWSNYYSYKCKFVFLGQSLKLDLAIHPNFSE
jgi:hypothetical protein